MNVAYAAEVAHAAGLPPTGGAGSMLPQLFFFAAIFAIFYFLLIRPQQKERRRREQMLASLKKGDRVVTSGGLYGTVVGLNEHTVILKIADQVKVEVDRPAVSRVASGEPAKDS